MGRLIFILFCLVFADSARAAAISSTAGGVAISEMGVSAGGNRSQGLKVLVDSMFGDPIDGAGQGTDNELRAGVAGQYYIPVTLEAHAPASSVPESSAFQLSASSVNDDGSYTADQQVSWNILGGPVNSVDGGGVAVAGTVYQDTTAMLWAGIGGLSATTSVMVADTVKDNYGLYALDGVSDAWQVGNFGTNSELGAATVDADGDGQSNFTEFMAGTSPTDAGDVFRIQGVRRGAGGMDLVLVPAFSNRTYHIEASTDLKTTNWVEVATSAGPTQTLQLAVNNVLAAGPVMFYRAVIDYVW